LVWRQGRFGEFSSRHLAHYNSCFYLVARALKLFVVKQILSVLSPIALAIRIVTIRRDKATRNADLIELSGFTSKRLNESIKRAAACFPIDFAFLVANGESAVSLMPEGLVKALKPQELRDLFSCLQSQNPTPPKP
jgi:hypothetical protein